MEDYFHHHNTIIIDYCEIKFHNSDFFPLHFEFISYNCKFSSFYQKCKNSLHLIILHVHVESKHLKFRFVKCKLNSEKTVNSKMSALELRDRNL